MVSASNATLPETATTASCKTAVIARITNDHLTAQIPRAVVAMVGSMTPWVWPRPVTVIMMMSVVIRGRGEAEPGSRGAKHGGGSPVVPTGSA